MRATSAPDLPTYPRASNGALLRLLGVLAFATIRRKGRGPAVAAWIADQHRRHGSRNVTVRLPFKQFVFAGEPAFSEHVLAGVPGDGAYVEGALKRSSMAFLAPRALTISHGAEWRRRREFNERVLSSDAPEFRGGVLRAVEDAFVAPVASAEELRSRMRGVMLDVVLGKDAPRHLAEDVDTLVAVVGNPLRRLLLGWRYGKRKRRFYDTLRAQRTRAPANSLLGTAVQIPSLSADEAIEQVPHWMFTFAGSASDLLLRTLAFAGSRPEVARRIAEEASSVGEVIEPESINRLAYLESCILEAGRLFPPVALTFHTPPEGDTFGGHSIPAGAEVVHYFPFNHRGDDAGSDVHRFDPERADASSNLFLSGPRACPGRDLILFVLKSAALTLLAKHQLRVVAPSLRADPVPLSFLERELRFSHELTARRTQGE
jgi:cytochrome P450